MQTIRWSDEVRAAEFSALDDEVTVGKREMDLARSIVRDLEADFEPEQYVDEYQEQLRSNFADMANIGGRPGGSITAASFLARFTRKLRWAHLDIAGPSTNNGSPFGHTPSGATGVTVRGLTRTLVTMARSAD